ncbi:hypothetical protein B9T19_09300 [Ignatzschineria sp. F8392]|uniref:NYN domain-containing protein n=1 Tax=Ignatzschineria sp. F8392 TaxID=1980117 RepID=UPI000B98A8AE|nr:NYN domain-containing protein [Ignatzschineria sp. F8392]OYQ77961.1 hypothetical protein B9T19_09300 [Ignatzschineria sp. F8392]
MTAHSPNIVVLIDADNTSHTLMGAILEEVAKYGTAYVKQVYGDWSSPALKSWKEKCLSHGLVAVQQFAYTPSKNATDIAMVIDAMDLLHSQQFDIFCIVSSDSDFTGLVSRIRKNGIQVYGIGKQSAPEAFRRSCDKYIFIDNLLVRDEASTKCIVSPVDSENNSVQTGQKEVWDQISLRSDLSLLKLIRNAIKEHDQDTGWVSLGVVGSYINKIDPEFDARNYGYSKLSELIEAIALFRLDRQKNILHIACKLPKSELKEVREVIKKYSHDGKDGELLDKNLIGQAFKDRGVHYKEAFGCGSLTSFLKKIASW